MHLYNIVIKGNDTFQFGHVTQQPSMEDAIKEMQRIVKSLGEQTIERFVLVSVTFIR